MTRNPLQHAIDVLDAFISTADALDRARGGQAVRLTFAVDEGVANALREAAAGLRDSKKALDATTAYLAGVFASLEQPIGRPDVFAQLATLRALANSCVRMLVGAGALEPPRFEREARITPMRTYDELQRAHDLLVGIMLGDVPSESRRDPSIHAAAEVLCWALHHDHNTAFTTKLHVIEQELRARGFVLERGSPT
jgi:hypothetical protein